MEFLVAWPEVVNMQAIHNLRIPAVMSPFQAFFGLYTLLDEHHSSTFFGSTYLLIPKITICGWDG